MMLNMETFRCITSHLAQKPDYVTWHFEERVIFFADFQRHDDDNEDHEVDDVL